jgi:hypothetical protein
MTVQEVFDLRRAGKVDEAYEAIIPMYRVHHGRYTTLAMFWCAVDKMNLLLTRVTSADDESLAALDEAERIFKSLERLYPNLNDEQGACKQILNGLSIALRDTRLRTLPEE